MNNYPLEYTFQPSPLVFVQGLGQDGVPEGSAKDLRRKEGPSIHNPLLINADTIKRGLDTVKTSSGLELVLLFEKYSLVDETIWEDELVESSEFIKYRFKFVGNEFLLPKASVLVEDPEAETRPKSPLSPFDENSDLYPDGIISANWIQKYKDIIPAVFISIHELDADSDELNDVGLVEEISTLKDQITGRGIKFMCIIVCSRSTVLNPDLVERVGKIKKLTNLVNKNSLLFLPSGTEKELKVFMNQLIHSMKPLCLDFYSAVEKKIKKKKARQSSLQSSLPQGLLQPFWDTRYSVKLAIIEEFKLSMENALKFWDLAYNSILEIFKSFPKDHKRWNECRMLLDFIVFHTVRCLLYMKDCNAAFYRFDNHLQNVLFFLKKHEIKPKSYSVLTWINCQFVWFLGLLEYVPNKIIPVDIPYEITDKLSVSMPNAGYLYLTAVSLVEKRRQQALTYQEGDFVDPYLSLSIEEERKFDYNQESINLLKKALLFFNKSQYFKRCENYIRFEMANFYFKSQDFSSALEQYEECLDFGIKDLNWKEIETQVLVGVYQCCQSLSLDSKAVETLLKLSTRSLTENYTVPKCDETIKATSLIYDVEFIFPDSTNSMHEEIRAQLKLDSKIESIFNDLQVESLKLQFDNDAPDILLEHSDLESDLLQIVRLELQDGSFRGKVNFKSSTVVQFQNLILNKTGKMSVSPTVSIFCKYKDLFKLDCELPLISKTERYIWYSSASKRLHKDYLKLSKPLQISILPRRPSVSITVDETKPYYNGETLLVAFNINNKDHELVKLKLDINDVSLIESVNANEDKSVTAQVTFAKEGKKFKIPVKISFYNNEDDEIVVEEEVKFEFNCIEPLKSKLNVLPRFRVDDMPTPFIKTDPIASPSRYWCCRQFILCNTDIEIVSSLLEIEHEPNLRSNVCEIERKKLEDGSICFDQYFSLSSGINDIMIGKEIHIKLVNKVVWKRIGSEVTNEFVSSGFDASLSLFEPRCLLIVEEKERIELEYIIENPTRRIFQFSTTLETDIPVEGDLKNNTFPLLPFSRQILRYHCELKKQDQIPLLRVFDLQYKVNLPIIVISDDKVDTQLEKEVYVFKYKG